MQYYHSERLEQNVSKIQEDLPHIMSKFQVKGMQVAGHHRIIYSMTTNPKHCPLKFQLETVNNQLSQISGPQSSKTTGNQF
jgi:hypothetical protein